MRVLIVRHGEAVDEAPGLGDAGRWLSGKGRKRVRRAARWLAGKRKWRPATIWTSPLVRAVQTAEILAEVLELDDDVSVRHELMPGKASDVPALLAAFQGETPLALVGHEPDLSALASTLLGSTVAGIEKGGVVAIDWVDGEGGELAFSVAPRSLD